jgi:hypothetical protein
MVRQVDNIPHEAVTRLKFKDVVTRCEGDGVAVRTAAPARSTQAARSAADRAARDDGKIRTDNARASIASIAAQSTGRPAIAAIATRSRARRQG